MAEDEDSIASLPIPAAFQRANIGTMLAEARTAAGRDLADIARETRVPLRHLQAIEANEHEALPALPYAVGFVKSYARCVGINPEGAAAQFRAETRLTPHVPSPINLELVDEARLPSRGLAWASLGVLVIVVIGLGLYGSGMFDPAPPPADVVAVADVPTDPSSAGAPVPPVASGAPATGDGSVAAAPAAPTEMAVQPAIPVAGAVVLTAKEDVWVKIYDRASGRRAFMGMLSAGQHYEVPADGPPLTLRSGRAGMVEVRVAGVTLPPLGGPVQTIDGVVLTAPALAARFAPPPPVASPPVAAPVQPLARPPAANAGQQGAPTVPAAAPVSGG